MSFEIYLFLNSFTLNATFLLISASLPSCCSLYNLVKLECELNLKEHSSNMPRSHFTTLVTVCRVNACMAVPGMVRLS